MLASIKAVEVEAMWVNDRVVVSANELKHIEDLRAKAFETVLRDATPDAVAAWEAFEYRRREKLVDVVNVMGREGADDASVRRGATRLGRFEVDLAQFPNQLAAVNGILATFRAELDKTKFATGDATDAGNWLTADSHKHRIVVMSAPKPETGAFCSHAEQNLVYALVLSGHKGEAVVAGGKRPCTVCWLTMRLARLKGFNLTIWHGLYAPKNTPKAVIDKVNGALRAALKDADFHKRQEALGAVIVSDARVGTAEHKKFVEAEINKLGPVIKAAGQYAD